VKKFGIGIAVLAACVSMTAQAQFAQLSSSETQLGETTVTFDQIDGLVGMTYSDGGGLMVNSAGAYFVIAAPQVITGKGCYNAWLTVNGQQVSHSNVQYCSQLPHQTDVIVSQGAGCFAEGDVINVLQSGTGIKAIHPEGEPQIPSIIFTAFKIGEC
jgi:hypothetical protein